MIIYFTITSEGGKGGRGAGRRAAETSCLCENCYLCPFHGCTHYRGTMETRTHGDEAAIEWAKKRRPKSFKIIRIIDEEKGAGKQWQ